MTYSKLIQNLATNLLNHFDEVYFNAEIVKLEKEYYPAIIRDGEWINLAPTDQTEVLYIRRNGDDEVYEEQKIGSCTKSYRMRSAMRIVCFKANGNNRDEILFKLLQSVLTQGIKLKSIIRDKSRLFKDESSGEYTFSPKTIYLAIDVYVFWALQDDICEQDCIELQNPMSKVMV